MKLRLLNNNPYHRHSRSRINLQNHFSKIQKERILKYQHLMKKYFLEIKLQDLYKCLLIMNLNK